MDAVYTTFKKSLLLFSLALLWLGPLNSRANAQSITTCGSVALTSQTFQVPCTISSSTGTIAYSTSIAVTPGDPNGWIGVSPSSGSVTTSGATLVVQLQNTAGLTSGTHTATIAVNATSPAGATGGTISVTYTPGAGGGTGGGGLITASALQTFCPTSACSNSQTLTLSTTSATPVTFTISPPSWISLFQTSGSFNNTLSSSSPATFTVSVNNFSAAVTGTNIVVSYNNTSLNVPITVTSTGGGGGGIINPNPSTVTLFYNTGSSLPSSTVTFTDSSGPSEWAVYSQISTAGDQNWLNLNNTNNSSLGYTPFSGSASFTVGVNSGVVGTLSNGSHVATLTIYDYPGGNISQVSVILNVNNGSGGGSGNLSANPSSLTLQSVGAGSTNPVASSVAISSSTLSGTVTYALSGTCSGITVSFGSGSSIFAGSGGVPMTVAGYPSGLSNTTDNCNITVTLLNSTGVSVASVIVPVSWTIGAGNGTGTGSASNPVLPISLNFATEGSSATPLVPQVVTITAAGNWTATASSTPGWLLINGSSSTSGTSTGTSTATVSINPAGLTAQTYTGQINFNTANGAQTVNVTLLNTGSTPVLYVTPQASFSLLANSGTLYGSTPQFQVFTSDNSAVNFTAATSASWLVLSSGSSGTLGGLVSVGIDPSQLANGVYVGTINITASNASNSPLSVPVVLTVSGSTATGGGGNGTLAITPSSMTFNAQVNGAVPASQSLTASAPAGTSFYAYATGTNNGITWLSISPAYQYNTSTVQNYTVSVNQTGLPIGTYTGTINFYQTSGQSQTINVTLNVSTTGTGGGTSVTSSPASLAFSGNQGGALPAAQGLTISSTSGAVTFTAAATVQNGGTTWLSVSPLSGTTTTSTGTLAVNVNQAGLAAGTYNGSVVVTPSGGSPLTIPVTFTVAGLPAISASPTTLNMTYSVGGISPTASINVTGGTALTYSASVSSACNCFTISPSTGDTTNNPTVTVSLNNPTTLTAGTYTGTVTITGNTNSSGSATVSVTLTVTAPLPTISAVVNAASGAAGPVSPGEVVSIFAPSSNPIGPVTPVSLSGSNLVNGNVPLTGLGGVKVTFNGYPAAVIYASASQINAVVPYEVAGFATFPVVVSYLGQTSNGFTVQSTTTVPGIFTQNGAGSGPAAILNANGVTVNGPNAPAPRGSTVAVFMTGEGATTPKGVDGAVTCSAGCATISSIPIPLLPVSVLVDNQPAQVVFYGEAPSLVSGVMQVNFTIPSGARTGAVPLVISVGGNQSQASVTVSVQ